MRRMLRSITQRLSPPTLCTLCNQFHKNTLAVCTECYSKILRAGPACPSCANPLALKENTLCGACLQQKPWFDATYVPCPFEEPLRTLLHQYKYQEHLYLLNIFADLMMDALPTKLEADYLIPVPLHNKRLAARGFNQAALLAKKLAKRCRIPLKVDVCQKRISTVPQTTLTFRERQTNLHNAFHLKPFKADYVVIVDDLMTTGSTVNELARVLKLGGVKKVDVWCCARRG